MTTVRFVWWTTHDPTFQTLVISRRVFRSPPNFARLIRLQRPPLPLRASHARREAGMGKKKPNEKQRSSTASGVNVGGGVGLNDREFQAVADAGAELVEEAAAAAELTTGGAKTTNPQLQMRLDLLAELGKRGDIRGFVRVFVPHDLTRTTPTTSPRSWRRIPRDGGSWWRKCRSSRTARR